MNSNNPKVQGEQQVKAALFGYLVGTYGSVQTVKVNKLLLQLNYGKMKQVQVKSFRDTIAGSESLLSVYKQALNREITLEDLENAAGQDKGIDEERVHDILTPAVVDHQDFLAKNRELRHLQRTGAHMQILMRELRNNLREDLSGLLEEHKHKEQPKPLQEIKDADKALILCFSDWHIGALVYNNDTGGYNYEKLGSSIASVISYVHSVIDMMDIDMICVYHVGDVIEHINMRNVNQAFEAEFAATKQISLGIRMLAETIEELSNIRPVRFGIVGGNHDRFQGNKNDKIYNDNVAYIIIDQLFFLKENGLLRNVSLIDNREDIYDFHEEVLGRNIMVSHGDTEKQADKVKIGKHLRDKPIDIYIMGHIHHTVIREEDYGRFSINVNSPMGNNNFAKEINAARNYGGQFAMVISRGWTTPVMIPMVIKEGKVI